MYLNPSQMAIEPPREIGYKNPIVDSQQWCNGNTENILSVGYNLTYAVTALIFSAKFLLFSITPFEFDVVPDVKNNILNSSGSISISSKLLLPDSIRFFPKSIKCCNPTSLPSNFLSDFISIKYSTSGRSSFNFFISSSFFGEYIIADAFDLFTIFSNSFNGNSLSVGTAIPTPHSIAI